MLMYFGNFQLFNKFFLIENPFATLEKIFLSKLHEISVISMNLQLNLDPFDSNTGFWISYRRTRCSNNI